MADAVIRVIDPMSQLTLGQGVVDAEWLPGVHGGLLTVDITVDQGVRALGLPRGLPANLTVVIHVAPPVLEAVPARRCNYHDAPALPGGDLCQECEDYRDKVDAEEADQAPPTRENPVWKGKIHEAAN